MEGGPEMGGMPPSGPMLEGMPDGLPPVVEIDDDTAGLPPVIEIGEAVAPA
jgi:hypothetical protein